MNPAARSRHGSPSLGGAFSGQAPWGHTSRPATNCATGHVFRVSLQVPADAGSGSPRAVEPRDEAAELQRQYTEATRALLKMSERIERLRSVA